MQSYFQDLHQGGLQTVSHAVPHAQYLQNTTIPYSRPLPVLFQRAQTSPCDNSPAVSIHQSLVNPLQSVMSRMDDFQVSLAALSGSVSARHAEYIGQFDGLSRLLEASHIKQIRGIQVAVDMLERVEHSLGIPLQDTKKPFVTIMHQISGIEEKVQKLAERIDESEFCRSLSTIVRREGYTSTHLPSQGPLEKEYVDAGVGSSIPLPTLVSRSTSTVQAVVKTYSDMSAGSPVTLPPLALRSMDTQHPEVTHRTIDVGCPISPRVSLPRSPTPDRNLDGSPNLLNSDCSTHVSAYNTRSKYRFETPDFPFERLVPATWSRPESELTNSGAPSTEYDNFKRNSVVEDDLNHDLIYGLVGELQATVFGESLPVLAQSITHFCSDVQQPSFPITQELEEMPSALPEDGRITLPNEGIPEHQNSFGTAIATSLIFGPPSDGVSSLLDTNDEDYNLINPPVDPGWRLDPGMSSPLTCLGSDDDRQSSGTNQLKRKKSSNLISMSTQPTKRGRTKKTTIITSRDKQRTIRKPTAGKKSDPEDPVRDIIWPDIFEGDSSFQRQFIQCDKCLSWYHYGCVGITHDDPRLDPDVSFECPPCVIAVDEEAIMETGNQEEMCSRPNCSKLNKNEFFAEKLMGRRMKKAGNEYEWLVKYDGYHEKDCTWEVRANIGAYEKLIEDFLEAARGEGLDVDERLEDTILLAKAAKYAYLWT